MTTKKIGSQTLKSVKLTLEAIVAINQFKKEFQMKNQSDAVVLAVGWAKEFFATEKQVKDDLVSRTKQLELLTSALVKQLQRQDGAITKTWLQAQVLMKLHPEAEGELKKLVMAIQKAKAELKGVVTTKQNLVEKIEKKEK